MIGRSEAVWRKSEDVFGGSPWAVAMATVVVSLATAVGKRAEARVLVAGLLGADFDVVYKVVPAAAGWKLHATWQQMM